MDIYSAAKHLDVFDPKAVDAIDGAMIKLAYEYDNPMLDNTVELKLKYFKNNKSVMPEKLISDKSFDSIANSSDTVKFFVDYYAGAFIEQGYSPSYAMFNILNLLYLMKEDSNAEYLPELFSKFKSNIAANERNHFRGAVSVFR